MSIEQLQERYEELRTRPPSTYPGLVQYHGSEDAKHIILGEDHSDLASIVLCDTIRALILPGRTLVLGEAAQGARQGTISTYEDAWEYRNDLTRWQQDIIQDLIRYDVLLQLYDNSGQARRAATFLDSQNDAQFMIANSKRDYALSTMFKEKCAEYDRVIGVFGTLHVLSPVIEQNLSDINYASYVVRPHDTP